MEININSKTVLAKHFQPIIKCTLKNAYTHYWLSGGRGSTKSSCASIAIITGIVNDAKNGEITNAVILRNWSKYLKDSVYNQLIWAIDMLGLSSYFEYKLSPLKIIFKPTGQEILFKGADNPKKIKSIKFKKGYCKYVWFEELDEFSCMEDVRNILQSLLRGGDNYCVFYSYNPPKSINSWVNAEAKYTRPDRLTNHSTYKQVNPLWLGEQFLIEAEHLEKVKPDKYRHEYLGEAIGTGGEVFDNVTLRKITDEEIKRFDKLKRGIDWGYKVDPFAYGVMYFDKTRRKLYIFFEIYKVRLSNREAMRLIKEENIYNQLIVCDSQEGKSIDELRDNGINAIGAKKGPDSIDYGIKYLQDLEEIIIDDERCPNAANEFTTYELERDKNGNFKSGYPDKNNHIIDLCRYALESEMDKRKWNENTLNRFYGT
jgi:PBSX family phage terminase large subunit